MLTLEFAKVKYVIGEDLFTGLINYNDCSQLGELPKSISCTSSCQIQLNDSDYNVFWKWTKTFQELDQQWEETSISDSDISRISETTASDEGSAQTVTEYSTEENGSSEEEENKVKPIFHTLPFKVVGVAHSTRTQDHLEGTLNRMKEHGETVSAMLLPEPENEFDKDAIAVHIDYGQGPSFIGYIPRELTKYIHPLLEPGQIREVKVADIRFRTQFKKFGLYIKLLITRVGRWEPFVVRASLSVQ